MSTAGEIVRCMAKENPDSRIFLNGNIVSHGDPFYKIEHIIEIIMLREDGSVVFSKHPIQ